MIRHTPWRYNNASEMDVKFIENVVTKCTVMLWKDDATVRVFCRIHPSEDQLKSHSSRLFHDESRAEQYALKQLT